jgi:hypothetical protein
MKNSDEPHSVYWIYGEEGTLLYIGMSFSPAVRLGCHRGRPGWRAVSRIDLIWYENRDLAAIAEAEAIAVHQPPWNVSGTLKASGHPGKAYALMTLICEQARPGGLYRIGDQLPSVVELAQANGVSVATVQSALARLRDRGIVRDHPGVGVFVAARPEKEGTT